MIDNLWRKITSQIEPTEENLNKWIDEYINRAGIVLYEVKLGINGINTHDINANSYRLDSYLKDLKKKRLKIDEDVFLEIGKLTTLLSSLLYFNKKMKRN